MSFQSEDVAPVLMLTGLALMTFPLIAYLYGLYDWKVVSSGVGGAIFLVGLSLEVGGPLDESGVSNENYDNDYPENVGS